MIIFGNLFIPIGITIIIHLNYIIKYKKCMKKAGKNIHLIQKKYLSYLTIAMIIILIVILIIVLIISKNMSIYNIIQYLLVLSVMISINLFEKIYGIYENGLIWYWYKYIAWDNVLSYKWINNETISFLLKTGKRIDFDKIMEKDKIIDLVLEKNIMRNN